MHADDEQRAGVREGRVETALASRLVRAGAARRDLWHRPRDRTETLAVYLCVALLASGLAVFTTATLVRLASPPRLVPALDHWLYDGLIVGAAVVCAWRALRVRDSRSGWSLVALGMSLYAGGAIWTSFLLGGDASAPYPSVADGLNLAFYPCAYLGLALIARPQIRSAHPGLWLDGAIAALGASAFVSAFVIERVAADTSGRFTVVATTMAYPLCDVVLLCLIATVAALCSWRLEPRWWFIVGGVLLFTAADLLFALEQSAGTYHEGTPLDVGWPAGVALVACAAWMRERPRRVRLESRLAGAHVVPGFFTLGAIALLALSHGHGVGRLSIGLAVATLLAAALRTGLAFRELSTLADLRVEALTDELTQLGNRRLLGRRLTEAVERGLAFALLVIDLDGFKEVNDALGHASGDAVLVDSGHRLADLIAPSDLLVRLGGDEFAMLLVGEQARATAIAGRIAHALDEPFEVAGIPLRLAASIGIVCSPHDGVDPTELVRRADIAMYRAKAERTGHEVYEAQADEWSPERLALAGELRTAIERRELEVLYQPKALISTGLPHGLEALVRWRHPRRGVLSPGEFVPLAEQTGLMHALTVCVLERALADLALLQTRHPGLTVAVNVSVPTLLRADFPQQLDELLRTSGVSPTALEIEITEDVLMTDASRARILVRELRRRGIAVSIDDYGTGYSSLRYLRDLEVDWLKVDQAFVTGLSGHDSAARIVESTILLAHALGLRVVAEGVESTSEWNTLSAFGCDAAQGYFLARPLDRESIARWLDARRSTFAARVLRAA